jgi:class 3 adenylate cyclase
MLAAFIPMDRRQAMVHQRTLDGRITGAALFVDISDSTPLAVALSKELGGNWGAEVLLNHINLVYDALITTLHTYAGSVIGFAGDGLSCWFDEQFVTGSPAARAVACALAMQKVVARFNFLNPATRRNVSLQIKVAVAAGEARRFLVGEPSVHIIEVLAGTVVVQMVAGERLARPGEVIVNQAVVEQLGEELICSGWRHSQVDSFAVIDGLKSFVDLTPWPVLPDDGLSDEKLYSWVLPDLLHRRRIERNLMGDGDLRPSVALMLHLSGLDFEQDSAAEKLNRYVCWAQQTIRDYGGNLLQVTPEDKGAFLYAPFGAPLAHEDDGRRASLAALALQNPPGELSFLTPVQIGLNRGEVWAGISGSTQRCTYAVMGSPVNLAARLMMRTPPGHIWLAQTMYQPDSFRYDYLGTQSYKGFDQAVITYRLLAARLQEQALMGGRLVGRATELQQLETFAQPLFSRSPTTGRFAGVAFVFGEPGIGKSHLIRALQQQLGMSRSLEKRGAVTWLYGQADSLQPQAFSAFIPLLRHYFRQTSKADQSANRIHFETQFNRLIQQLAHDDTLRVALIHGRPFLGGL